LSSGPPKAPSPKAPSQARGEKRVAELKAAAESVFAQQGYEAATMTAIAKAAGAPIGSLYQFFPSKEALALTLMAQYLEEAAALIAKLKEGPVLDARTLAEELIGRSAGYLTAHPAWTVLAEAPALVAIKPDARGTLARMLEGILLAWAPKVPAMEMRAISTAAWQMVKSANALSRELPRAEGRKAAAEMRLALESYLRARAGLK
jgi:AcrR family transcriptional regulator